MNLGVYVSTLDEEVLIGATLKHVVKVFPQVEVIDLGSRDNTLACVKRFDIPVNRHVFQEKKTKRDLINAGAEWTRLKNEYAAKHDWVFFVDGDEIYDEKNLLKIKSNLDDKRYTAYRIGWKNVREHGGTVQKSEIVINGTKLYKTSDYVYHRSWPREVLIGGVMPLRKQPKEECDVWCWHGVMLERTQSVKEHTARYKKRQMKLEQYADLKWEDTYRWPWM